MERGAYENRMIRIKAAFWNCPLQRRPIRSLSRQEENKHVRSCRDKSTGYYAGALPNDDAECHGVARCRARHNRSIRDTKIVDAIDLEIAVNDRHCIASHLGRTRLMPVGDGSLANEVFQLSPFQVAGHHLGDERILRTAPISSPRLVLPNVPELGHSFLSLPDFLWAHSSGNSSPLRPTRLLLSRLLTRRFL